MTGRSRVSLSGWPRFLGFAVTVVVVSAVMIGVAFVHRQILDSFITNLVQESDPEPAGWSTVRGYAEHLVVGLVDGAISWVMIRRTGPNTFATSLVAASAGPAVVAVLGMPLILVLRWPFAIYILVGFVLSAMGFALTTYLTRDRSN